MKEATVIGHYGVGYTYLDGQTIKTKNITSELDVIFGIGKIDKVDTHGRVKKILLPLFLLRALIHSRNIVILPAQNGLCVLAPLIVIENLLFHRNLHYVVIGGWLQQYLISHRITRRALKKFNGIYPETMTMKRALENMGFMNVFVMPNFKNLSISSENELVFPKREPYKLCTFSRVMKEKGIEDAVFAVEQVNSYYGKTVYTLDVYGQVDETQKEWFEDLKKCFPPYVTYKGLISSEKSVDVLKHYSALLFPTHFFTEGVPGTIIDAYSAGIPVIASKWESFDDVVEEGITGIGYQFADKTELFDCLLQLSQNTSLLLKMKKQCLKKSADYLPSSVIRVLTNRFSEDNYVD